MLGELDTVSNGLFDFFKAHAAGRIELLTISIPRGSNLNLEECFKALIIRIAGQEKEGHITLCRGSCGCPSGTCSYPLGQTLRPL